MRSDLGLRSRQSFGKTPDILELPNLIAVQVDSFKWFIEEGLADAFRDISPIEDFTGNLAIEFGKYRFGEPEHSVGECKERDMTYSARLDVTVSLINKTTGEIKEEEVYMGDFPIMTNKGTFIINGTERVVVSQLVRSPGVYFDREVDKHSDKILYFGKVIPSRGAWLEFETDKRDVIGVRVDRKRKQPATILLKALGFGSNEEILKLFNDADPIKQTLEKDFTETREEAMVELYKRLRPGEPPAIESARTLIDNLFFNPQRYDLAKVGRYKVNKKLGLKLPENTTVLTRDDILATVQYMVALVNPSMFTDRFDLIVTDDIDHFGNRRVRSVGELIQNQFRIGLARMERVVDSDIAYIAKGKFEED